MGDQRVVGIRASLEVLRAKRRKVTALFYRGPIPKAPRQELNELLDLANDSKVPFRTLQSGEFEARAPAGVRHQNVLLEVEALPIYSLQELCSEFADATSLIALDGVEDPQNLGAIIRVAVAAGVDAAILPKRRSAPVGPTALRASAGALEHLPLVVVANLGTALDRLREIGFEAFGADPDAAISLYSPEGYAEKRVLVMGGEGRGLRPGIRRHLDRLIRIPMSNRIGSLNVSTAAAVCLFHWMERAGLKE